MVLGSRRGRSRTRRSRKIRGCLEIQGIQEHRDSECDSKSVLHDDPFPAWFLYSALFGASGWGLALSVSLLAIAILISFSFEGGRLPIFLSWNYTQRVSDKSPNFEIDALIDRTTRFGERQKAKGNQKAVDKVKEMLHYMESSDTFLSLPETRRLRCRNQNELCCFWAATGACDSDESSSSSSFMTTHCAPGRKIMIG